MVDANPLCRELTSKLVDANWPSIVTKKVLDLLMGWGTGQKPANWTIKCCGQYPIGFAQEDFERPFPTCEVIQYYNNGIRNCSQDMQQCGRIDCYNSYDVNSTEFISNLTVVLLPCGEGGMGPPAIMVTATDFSHQTLVNRTFFESTSVALSGRDSIYLNVSFTTFVEIRFQVNNNSTYS